MPSWPRAEPTKGARPCLTRMCIRSSSALVRAMKRWMRRYSSRVPASWATAFRSAIQCSESEVRLKIIPLEELGAEAGEERGHRLAVAIGQLVERLQQRGEVGGHQQQVAAAAGTRVPIGVGHAGRREHQLARAGLELPAVEAEPQPSFEDVPGLVVAVMAVQRRDVARRRGFAAFVLPLRDGKPVGNRLLAGQRSLEELGHAVGFSERAVAISTTSSSLTPMPSRWL